MTAKEYLWQYRDTVHEIQCKTAEKLRIYEDATHMSPSPEAFTASGNVGDKVGKGGAAAADIAAQIDREIVRCEELLAEIRATIAAVPDSTLRQVLTYRYIAGLEWENIALTMNYSFPHVTGYLHSRALKKVVEILENNKQ